MLYNTTLDYKCSGSIFEFVPVVTESFSHKVGFIIDGQTRHAPLAKPRENDHLKGAFAKTESEYTLRNGRTEQNWF